jgi:phenylalanyl-tRNA synthetase alpha chain
MQVIKELNKILDNALQEIQNVGSLKDISGLRVRYLGRKSRIVAVLKGLGSLSKELRPEVGRTSNEIKQKIERALDQRSEELSNDIFKGLGTLERIDVTEPGITGARGTLHPITQLSMELEDIFISMGFSIAAGPEIELDYYNFEALNIPQDHPARDIQDTIWTVDGTLLRTHTSSVQIRTMEKQKPPIRVVAPGRVFRYEETDASHEHTFYQVEGLMVDRDISVAHLIAVMRTMLREVFRKDVKVRLRPGYFPFVEPGFELDISCHLCDGKGCPVCKESGWEELIGCGLVHPNVLSMCGIDPVKYSGFAFGMGLDRLVMMRYGIDDIRLFHSGNLRFLRQF